jgi:branched-chain amino acid transport system substrate-binding protein
MFFGFPAWSEDMVKIGVIGPTNFVQGKGHWNGANMAADEINGEGGVQVGGKKMKIELVKADSNEFLNVTDAPEITYKGIVAYKIPPWVVDAYKK